MLLEFQVENYLSFKEKATLSMIASPSINKNELKNSMFCINGIRILKSAAIFGANASGKSNFIKAIDFMVDFISNSAKESTFGKKIRVENFKLSEETINQPTALEITFLVKNPTPYSSKEYIEFRYGFQINKYKVESEWLFARFTKIESTLFTRFGDHIKIFEKFKEGKQIYKTIGNINKTTLFLSLIANIKGENAPITNMVMNWFTNLRDITPIANDNFAIITADLMKNKQVKNEILKALALADMCIEDIIVNKKKLDFNQLPEDMKQEINKKKLADLFSIKLKTLHSKYNSKKQSVGKVSFDFKDEESDGTKKFFAIIGPILSALNNGLVLVIDEIDTRLHPNLCSFLISMFNSKRINRKNAQLIFASHNTLIMNRKILRRDQIYLVEKDKYGASELYSLLDYKKVRNDASYNKDYLMGKYGAVPFLGNFESLFNKEG